MSVFMILLVLLATLRSARAIRIRTGLQQHSRVQHTHSLASNVDLTLRTLSNLRLDLEPVTKTPNKAALAELMQKLHKESPDDFHACLGGSVDAKEVSSWLIP